MHLVSLHVRRRPWVAALAGVAVAGAMFAGGEGGVAVQAGVLPDGFVVMHGGAGARRVVVMDPSGEERYDAPFTVRADARVVGARVGAVVGWHDRDKVQLAHVDDEGSLLHPSTWGKSAQKLCAGVASNDDRFAIGWLEGDGAVWFVHGPLAAAGAADDVPIEIHDPLKASWCAIASAEQNVALLWRSKKNYNLLFCTAKSCGGYFARVDVDPQDTILGVGCLRDSCMIASRGQRGPVRLHHVSLTGKVKWSRTLAVGVEEAAIVGVGDRGFAVATAGQGAVQVQRFTLEGAATPVWHGAGAAPSLAWSKGQLAVATAHGREVVTEVVSLPR